MVKGHHSRTCLSASKCPPLCISSPPQHHYTTSKPPCSGAHQLHTQTYIIHTHKHTYQGFIQKGGALGYPPPNIHTNIHHTHTQTCIIYTHTNIHHTHTNIHHTHTQTYIIHTHKHTSYTHKHTSYASLLVQGLTTNTHKQSIFYTL